MPKRLLGCLLVLAALWLCVHADPALACPTCKVALANHDVAQGDLVGGFFWSILFMVSMPFVIFGTLAMLMYREVTKARRQQASVQSTETARERPDYAPAPLSGGGSFSPSV